MNYDHKTLIYCKRTAPKSGQSGPASATSTPRDGTKPEKPAKRRSLTKASDNPTGSSAAEQQTEPQEQSLMMQTLQADLKQMTIPPLKLHLSAPPADGVSSSKSEQRRSRQHKGSADDAVAPETSNSSCNSYAFVDSLARTMSKDLMVDESDTESNASDDEDKQAWQSRFFGPAAGASRASQIRARRSHADSTASLLPSPRQSPRGYGGASPRQSAADGAAPLLSPRQYGVLNSPRQNKVHDVSEPLLSPRQFGVTTPRQSQRFDAGEQPLMSPRQHGVLNSPRQPAVRDVPEQPKALSPGFLQAVAQAPTNKIEPKKTDFDLSVPGSPLEQTKASQELTDSGALANPFIDLSTAAGCQELQSYDRDTASLLTSKPFAFNSHFKADAQSRCSFPEQGNQVIALRV